jgi:hypothetical protein
MKLFILCFLLIGSAVSDVGNFILDRHTQFIKAIYMDCDDDVILLKVKQIGGIACHTGRKSCFFQKLMTTS